MKTHSLRRAYSFLLTLILFLSILLSPIFPSKAQATDTVELSVGQNKQLLTTLSNVTWKSSDNSIAAVDDNGNVQALGVGITEIRAVSGGKVQHRTLLVRAPSATPVFNTRNAIRNALTQAASQNKTQMTFRFYVPGIPSGDAKAKQRIMEYFPNADEFYVAYCRELRFNFIWTNESNNTAMVETTCIFKYASSSEVAAAYRGDEVKLSTDAALLKEKCDEIIKEPGLRSMKTKYERVLAVHDYIVKKASYHKAAVGKSEQYPDSFSAFGVLVQGKGVCQSYAEAMKLLLNAVDIECDYVVGIANENHVWNRVQLDDGNWYNVDATWDDPLPDKENEVSHKYFAITDKQLEKTHSWTDYTNRCSSTTYSYENIKKLINSK